MNTRSQSLHYQSLPHKLLPHKFLPIKIGPLAAAASITLLRRVTVTGLLAGVALFPLAGCKGRGSNFPGLTRLFHHRKSASKANSTDYAANLQNLAGQPRFDPLKWAEVSDIQPQVQKFYDDRDWELAWTRDGKPTPQATRLIELFGDAAKKGLQPEDYDSSRWGQRTQGLGYLLSAHDTSETAGNTIAQFDLAVTINAMRYLSDLHLGRINPQSLDFDIDVPARRAQFDLPTLLNDELVDADDLAKVAETVEPQNPMYKKTEEALPHYIELADAQAKQPLQPLPPVGKPIAPGGSYPAMLQLVQRLAVEGDTQAPAQGQATGSSYTPEIAQAVQGFQNRHGLMPDGKLTKETIDALNIPMSTRVGQIADSLERWRWLPDNFVKPRVLVNLPEYYVRTYNSGGDLAFKMKVVDGQNHDDHNTPVFVRTMRFVIFRPYWNLPPDIVKKDLLARHANAGYFESHGYEVTSHGGQPVTGWSMDDLEHARYAVRQKPGPTNSLGLVKFMFPNEYDVYMHSTPEMNLFNLAQRDRSHGCIRLNDPEKMANWVLNGQGDWDAGKIHEAMYGEPLPDASADTGSGSDANGKAGTPANAKPADDDPDSGPSSTAAEVKNNKQVNLQTPLPVVVGYFTANADEDGSMHFFNDMYSYDKSMEDALAKPRPYDQKTVKINPHMAAGGTE